MWTPRTILPGIVLLGIAVVFSFCGCGGTPPANPDAKNVEINPNESVDNIGKPEPNKK